MFKNIDSRSVTTKNVKHYVNERNIYPPYPKNTKTLVVGMGCFWGAERVFYEFQGVYVTAAGYAGGTIEYPSYEDVCTGKTNHAEVVKVVFECDKVSIQDLLRVFFESHDPTQKNRQGNDIGTQYRSLLILNTLEELQIARSIGLKYQAELDKNNLKKITTEYLIDLPFYYAEDYHQQYLAKNPSGYCGLKGTGVTCPTSYDN